MFKALFLGTLFVTLAVNIIFLLATRDKPPDLITTTTTSSTSGAPTSGRRLVLRSNDFYDYGATGTVRQSANISNNTTAARQTSEAWTHSNETRAIGSQRIGDNATQSVDWKDNSRATISDDEGDGDEEASNQVDDNEITTSNVNGGRELRIGVKSSRSHVLVSVDNSIIYESGAELFSSEERKQRARKQQRRKRRRRRHETRNSPWTVNESYSETTSDSDNNNNNTEANQNANLDAPSGSDESTRGIHVLVLSQFDGSLMAARSFDTYSSRQDSELVYFLNQLQPGRLLVFAIKDEGSFKLPARCEARRLLARLGSRQVQQLGWRDMWALVTRSRPLELETSARLGELKPEQSSSLALAEAINHSASFSSWAEPVHLEARVQLADWPPPSQFDCFAQQPRRRKFCERVEGYGRVCDCRHPSPVDFRPRPLANSQLAGVPLVVIASNRPYYLYRMLSSLLSADGVNKSQVTVFIDGFYREPAQVCELFNLRYIQHAPTGERSARISSHYKTSLATTFEQLFPEASYAIIFEEDLDVARDALAYFNATMELLERDPSLYCASAWNDQGYEHSAADAGRIYRVETMPGLGWMLSRELFLRELRDSWPSAQRQHDWDMWIRTAQVRRGRECLIPDVSRTFHFGATGTNINAYFQSQYFSKHAFSDNLSGEAAATSGRFKDLDKLEASSYERELERVLREEAQFIDYNVDQQAGSNATLTRQLRREFVCSLASTTGEWLNEVDNDQDNQIVQRANSRVPSNKTNVIFINMIDSDDFAVWLRLAKCWHLWDLDARGQHKSAWRLHLPARHSSQLEPTLVVGVPASPYARFKPSHLVPFDL